MWGCDREGKKRGRGMWRGLGWGGGLRGVLTSFVYSCQKGGKWVRQGGLNIRFFKALSVRVDVVFIDLCL